MLIFLLTGKSDFCITYVSIQKTYVFYMNGEDVEQFVHFFAVFFIAGG